MTQEARNMAAAEKIMNITSFKAPAKIIKRYDGFVPLDEELLSNVEKTNGGLCFWDATPDALDTPLNVAAFKFMCEDAPSQCVRGRKADAKTIRRMTNQFSLDAYILDYIHFETGYINSIPVKVKKTEQFANAEIITPKGFIASEKNKEEAKKTISVLAGLQFLLENTCTIYLKPDKSSIGFTIPIGTLSAAKDIFKMRDIEPGKKRRTALQHFVAEHFRRLPSDPEETVKIARYLRGTQKFNWNGFECSINIPHFLLETKAGDANA